MLTKGSVQSAEIPIMFGISGHRNIIHEDAERAAKSLQRVIKHYRKIYSDTPFVFITPLADGADCIAARSAIEADSNLKLLVVYPFSIVEYAKTISTNWLSDFEELGSGNRVFKTINLAENLIPQDEEGRVEQYRKVGHFVAINSHILFVLKDNEGSKNDGGTAEIKEFRKNGCINYRILDDHKIQCAEEGLMYEIRVRKPNDRLSSKPSFDDDHYYFTPNIGGSQRSDSAGKALGIISSGSLIFLFIQKNIFKKYVDVVAQNIDCLNNLLRSQSISDQKPPSNSQLFQSALESVIQDRQKKYYFSLNLVFIFAALASIFQGFEKQLLEMPFFGDHHSLKFIFISIAFLFWGKTQLFDYKNTYESYRAIAEALRVQGYWFRIGYTSSAADFLLRAQIGPSSWVRRVVRSIWLMDYCGLQKASLQQPAISIQESSFLIEDWVQNQIEYFEKKIRSLKKQNFHFSLLIHSLLASTLLSFILSFTFVGHLFHLSEFWDSFFESVAETSFILFFLAKAYVEMKGFEIFLKRYEASEHTFRQMKEKYLYIDTSVTLSEQHRAATYRLLFRSLGESVLDEVSDWYIANTRMEFKPPGG